MRCEREDKACVEYNTRVLQELALRHWAAAEGSIDADAPAKSASETQAWGLRLVASWTALAWWQVVIQHSAVWSRMTRETAITKASIRRMPRDFQEGLVVKNLPANAGDTGSIPESGRFPGGGNGIPLQCSCLENPMARGVWWATVHGVAKSQTRLSVHTQTAKQIDS